MCEGCRDFVLGRRDQDFGGCRDQVRALTGDATPGDPVCQLSPAHHLVVAERETANDPSREQPDAQTAPVYLTMPDAAAAHV